MPRSLHFTLLHRSWGVWLAVLLAVFGALAPTVSHALVAARGEASPWLEICAGTGTGTRSVAPGWLDGTPDEDKPSALREACSFCLLNAERAAPPPTDQVHHFAATGAQGGPSFWQTVVVVSPFVFAAQPRGPPPLTTPFSAA